ncbi:MAG: lysostaphin resistance A-like protein [Myxococcota bacterium]
MNARPDAGAWPQETPKIETRAGAIIGSIGLFFIGVFSLICVAGGMGMIPLLIRGGLDPANPGLSMTGDVMALSFFAGFGAFAVLGIAFTLALGWQVRQAVGLRWPPIAGWVVAIVGGCTVGLLPGWIAEQLFLLFPELADNGTLEVIPRLLTDGTTFEQIAVLTTIVVGAPLLEEVCFRGLLWNALERALPGQKGQGLAFVITSSAFVLAHADLVQSPALIFTAFFLGWLRWTSGSVWPGIVAHFMNNGLAAMLTLLTIHYDWDLSASPLWLAVVGAVVTLALATLLWVYRRAPAATPEDAWAQVGRTEAWEDDAPTDPLTQANPA